MPMKAIIKAAASEGAELRSLPEYDSVPPGYALIKVQNVAICGTDYHVYSWDAWAAGRVKPPLVMGHEFAGEVIAVGEGVNSLAVGDFVSGESHKVCGHCLQCRIGQGHVCRHTQIFGVDTDGCFREYFAVPETSLIKNDPRIPPHIACLQDPLGNAVHAAMQGELAGRSVAVLGCGPIGLLSISVCRALGASWIAASDTSAYRLGIAEQVGADKLCRIPDDDMDAAVLAATDGQGVDVVLEMSGAVSAIQQAMRLARPGGRVSLMGIPSRTVELDLAEKVIFKGLTLHGVVGRRLYETWVTMQNLLANNRLCIEPILTHQLPFDDFAEGFSLMRSGQCGKVVLNVSE
ncbi:MAG: L-threonine 3-dehydrogenase [Armatimonas sp.]